MLAGSIQIANARNEIMGQVVVEMLHTKLQVFIDKNEWRNVKLLLRFLAVLQPIVEGEGIFNLFTLLLENAIEVQSAHLDKRIEFAEELYVAVLLALPFYVRSGGVIGGIDEQVANPELVSHAERLLELSRKFPTLRPENSLELLKPFVKRHDQDVPYEPREFVQLVRAALDKLEENKWNLSRHINILHMLRQMSDIEPLLGTQKKHSFPILNFSKEQALEKVQYAEKGYPRFFLQIYLPGAVETTPTPDTFEAVIFRDIATDVVTGMDFNRNEVTRQLTTLDLFFNDSAFAEPGMSIDKLELLEPGKSTWKVEDVALEAVLESMFKLPYALHKPAYYHAILIEACIMGPQEIAPVFGRAIRFLYGHLETLDVELIFRMLDWFSQHLSNFGFIWRWEEWKKFVGEDELAPKRVFIKELITKEVNLSYPARIKETLLEEFHTFVPDIPEEPLFKYLADEEGPYNELVQRLMNCFKQETKSEDKKEDKKEESEEMQVDKEESYESIMEEIKDKVTNETIGGSADDIETKLIDLLVTTICHMGNRSLSHVLNWITKCEQRLQKIVGDKFERQQDAIRAVMKYWTAQSHVGLTVIGFLQSHGIVSTLGILDYVLNHNQLLISSAGWECINESLAYRTSDAETLKDLVVKILASLSRKLEESSEDSGSWAKWWYNGLARVIARKYHKIVVEADELKELSNIKMYIEQAIEL